MKYCGGSPRVPSYLSMRLSVSLVVLGVLIGPAHADGYKMKKYPDNPCGNIRARAMAPLELLVDAPSEAVVEDMSVDKEPGAKLTTDDYRWSLRVIAASKKDLDFATAKKAVIDSAKKSRLKLTWKTAERTTDGYRLLYSEKSGSETDYTTVYLRTIQKQKWVCWNSSSWPEGHACIAKACESLRAP
jgi:hypothetical protein